MSCYFLLQKIFLTQGLNSYLLHWQMDSLPLSHLESPLKRLTFPLLIWYFLRTQMLLSEHCFHVAVERQQLWHFTLASGWQKTFLQLAPEHWKNKTALRVITSQAEFKKWGKINRKVQEYSTQPEHPERWKELLLTPRSLPPMGVKKGQMAQGCQLHSGAVGDPKVRFTS